MRTLLRTKEDLEDMADLKRAKARQEQNLEILCIRLRKVKKLV